MNPGNADRVYDETRRASGDTVAVLEWMAYDAPSGDEIHHTVNRDGAVAGATLLDADIDGLRAMRGDRSHLTVVAHSYGSTTAAIAAEHLGLATDDLVLLGSPGAGWAENAGDLVTGRAHTWTGSASHDVVSLLGRTGWMDPSDAASAFATNRTGYRFELLGNDPVEDDFGAIRIQAQTPDQALVSDVHSRYLRDGTESLYNVGAIVGGEYDDVVRAEHRYDPWYAPMQDPEANRPATTRRH